MQYLLCALRICFKATASVQQWSLRRISSINTVTAYSVKQPYGAYLSLVVGCAVVTTVNAWVTGPVLVLLTVLAVVTGGAIFFATQVGLLPVQASTVHYMTVLMGDQKFAKDETAACLCLQCVLRHAAFSICSAVMLQPCRTS